MKMGLKNPASSLQAVLHLHHQNIAHPLTLSQTVYMYHYHHTITLLHHINTRHHQKNKTISNDTLLNDEYMEAIRDLQHSFMQPPPQIHFCKNIGQAVDNWLWEFTPKEQQDVAVKIMHLLNRQQPHYYLKE